MHICLKCSSKIPSKIKLLGKDRTLSSRKFCLTCSPFNSRNTVNLAIKERPLNSIEGLPATKECPKCKTIKDKDEFYASKRKGQVRLGSYCKVCFNKITVKRQREFKQKCVIYKESICFDCKKEFPVEVYDFHHRDPKEKDITIADYKSKAFNDLIKRELDKCDLLCANCHRIRHIVC